jgi:4-hydroxy-tetrahydrodipicolinate synthase
MTTSQKGFIPVMLTPFKNNGAIDYDALTKLTEFYLEAGAAGLFANCLSSEMYELEPDERPCRLSLREPLAVL